MGRLEHCGGYKSEGCLLYRAGGSPKDDTQIAGSRQVQHEQLFEIRIKQPDKYAGAIIFIQEIGISGDIPPYYGVFTKFITYICGFLNTILKHILIQSLITFRFNELLEYR